MDRTKFLSRKQIELISITIVCEDNGCCLQSKATQPKLFDAMQWRKIISMIPLCSAQRKGKGMKMETQNLPGLTIAIKIREFKRISVETVPRSTLKTDPDEIPDVHCEMAI